MTRAWAAATVLAAMALSITAPGASATMPGKNGKIVFVEVGTHHPATINPDGSGRAELPPVGDFPAWSPDGSRIAFAPCFASSSSADRTCTTDATGGDLRRIPGTRDPEWPSWAPTGDRLVIDDEACGPTFCSVHAVVTMRLDGSNRTVLDFDGEIPDWSPDGATIAFTRFYPGGSALTADLFLVNADGTGVRPLTGAEQAYEAGPSWSPDGKKIAYTGFTPGTGFDIYVINADGTGRRQLTSGPFSEGTPAWSPDGTKIAYVDGQGIQIVNADGTGRTFLTQGLIPDWQPIPGPRRADLKNAAHFCKAERDFWGEADFQRRYGTNASGGNAFGKCVSAAG